jgi:hypothetical protein
VDRIARYRTREKFLGCPRDDFTTRPAFISSTIIANEIVKALSINSLNTALNIYLLPVRMSMVSKDKSRKITN